MKVCIVSWGLARERETVEIDAIVHDRLADAEAEFDLVDVAAVGKGKYDSVRAKGWGTYCRIDEVEMLDEREQPTSKKADWTYDGDRVTLKEKRG